MPLPLDQLKAAIPQQIKDINQSVVQTSKKSETPLDKFKALEEHKVTFATMKQEKRQILEDDTAFDRDIKSLRQDLRETQDKQALLETGLQRLLEERERQYIYFGNQSEIRPVLHDGASSSVEVGLQRQLRP